MNALLDTSFLFALANSKDRNHKRVLKFAQTVNTGLVLPVSVLPEVCYLIGSRLGHDAMCHFLRQLIHSDVVLETVTLADLERSTEILNQYADARLDFVDATIVSIAERLNISCVLTLDRRDFSIIRPRHCPHFEILP